MYYILRSLAKITLRELDANPFSNTTFPPSKAFSDSCKWFLLVYKVGREAYSQQLLDELLNDTNHMKQIASFLCWKTFDYICQSSRYPIYPVSLDLLFSNHWELCSLGLIKSLQTELFQHTFHLLNYFNIIFIVNFNLVFFVSPSRHPPEVAVEK